MTTIRTRLLKASAVLGFVLLSAGAAYAQDAQTADERKAAEQRKLIQDRTERMRLELEQKRLIPLQDKRTGMSGLSAVLVVGSLQPSVTTAEDIPAPARKALADMKDFLPYKSYELLDVAWLRGASGGSATLRLRGRGGQPYQLEVNGPDRVLGITAKLLELDTTSNQPSPASRPVLNTSFQMDIGETVVVGTSSLSGDKALILLLTVVGR